MSEPKTLPAQSPPGGEVPPLARGDWAAALALAAATLAVELGTYWLGRRGGANELGATLAALAAGALWVAMACPVAAAGSATVLGAVLRGGIVADASGVATLALAMLARDEHGRHYVTVLAALEIYCTYSAMALAAIAAVLCAKRPAGRYAAATAAALVLLAALAGPFWVNGLLRYSSHAQGQAIVAWAVLANPFYSIASAVAERTGFVWHTSPLMYQITRIGDYAAPPPVAWYAAAWRYALVAAVLTAFAILRRRRQQKVESGNRG